MGDVASDDAVLTDVGERLARRRVELGLQQAELAERAGVSKSTVERLERGQSTQLRNYVRVLRALELLDAWVAVHPQPGPRPMELLREQQSARKRVRKRVAKSSATAGAEWRWGDE